MEVEDSNLPHLDFDSVICNNEDMSFDEENFDVFAAGKNILYIESYCIFCLRAIILIFIAKGQSRRRSSIQQYKGKRRSSAQFTALTAEELALPTSLPISKEEQQQHTIDDDKENTNSNNIENRSPNIITTTISKSSTCFNPIDNIVTNLKCNIIVDTEKSVSLTVVAKTKVQASSASKAPLRATRSGTSVTTNNTLSTQSFIDDVDDDNTSLSVKTSMSVDTGATKALLKRSKLSNVSGSLTVASKKRVASNLFCKPTAASSVKYRSKQHQPTISTAVAATPAPANRATVRRQNTLPITPKFLAEKRSTLRASAAVSTDDKLYLEIEKAKKEIAARSLQVKKTFEKLKIRTHPHTVTRSTKELTIPSTPKSNLTKRLGKRQIKQIDNNNDMHTSKKQAASYKGGITQPEPFNFTTRQQTTVHIETIKTNAEIANEFMSNTRSNYVPINACSKLTEAVAPVLKTDMRSKSSHHAKPLSRDEQEDLEMKQINDLGGFRARPLDKRVFESMGELGVPQIKSKPTTETQEFAFHTDKRLGIVEKQETPTKQDNSNSNSNSRAWCPKRTVAVSPKFNGGKAPAAAAPSRRQREHHSITEKQKAIKPIVRRSSPLKLTEPKAFTFQTDEIYLQHKAALEGRVKAERENEEQLRKVKATAAPDTSRIKVPVKPIAKKATETEEFHLRSVKRHDEDIATQQQQQLQQQLKQQSDVTFRAIPLPRSTYEPTQVEHATHEKKPIQPIEMVLESDIRAQKRREFNSKMSMKLAEIERLKEIQIQEKQMQELKHMNELRRKPVDEGGMMFIAKEVMVEDQFPVRSTTAVRQSLTEAKSPYLMTKMRGGIKMPSNASSKCK